MSQKNIWTFALLCLLTVSVTNCAARTGGPRLQTVSVSSITAGIGAMTIDLYGYNFTQQSITMWNGSSRATTFLSSTHLRAAITAADTANPGTAQVQVRTAASSWFRYSNTLYVHIYSVLQVTTSSLGNGIQASSYTGSLTAKGGDATYMWTIIAGS